MYKTTFNVLIVVTLLAISSCKTEISGLPAAITDIDGNTYTTAQIGYQVWLQENLSVVHYNDGTPVTEVEGDTAWTQLQTNPAYCTYGNSVTYGYLYNWYAATDPRGLCPAGWRVPADSDWAVLSNYYGGDAISGGYLKPTISQWDAPNTGAGSYNNVSIFWAMPGGNRSYADGSYSNLGMIGNFWSSTPGGFNAVYYNSANLFRGVSYNTFGNSVRCIK